MDVYIHTYVNSSCAYVHSFYPWLIFCSPKTHRDEGGGGQRCAAVPGAQAAAPMLYSI